MPFPLFIVAFLALSVVRTLGDGLVSTLNIDWVNATWTSIIALAYQMSLLGFAMAMSALAMSVSPSEVKSLGPRGFIVAAVTTVSMLAVALLWLS